MFIVFISEITSSRQSANFSGIGFSIGIGINLSKTIFKNPTGKKAAN